MNIQTDALGREEAVAFELCRLYEQSGYRQFRMRHLEEYALYLENKNFLSSEYVIPFTGTDGRLMALKPDVTLSILKTTKATEKNTQKLYYRESVFRFDRRGGDYKEINQLGLEMLGGVDTFAGAELCMLAAQSLAAIKENYLLCFSHMGLLSAILAGLGLSEEKGKTLLPFLKSRNPHDLLECALKEGVDAKKAKKLVSLIDGTLSQSEAILAAKELAASDAGDSAANELLDLLNILGECGYKGRVQADFSVIADQSYYNGIAFFGYVEGVPQAILSGGRYDLLAKRFGKDISAMGFAVYVSELLRFESAQNAYDADIALIYSETDCPLSVAKAAQALRKSGKSTLAVKSLPKDAKVKEIVYFKEGAVC